MVDKYAPSTADSLWCFIHKQREPIGEYQCDECFHQFADEPTLIREHNEVMAVTDESLIRDGLLEEPGEAAGTLDQVTFCPWCTHDF